MVFNQRFRVEIKEFEVSVKTSGTVRIIERGSRMSTAIHMGRYGGIWMVNMVDKLRAVSKSEEFVAKFTELPRVFLAQHCANSRSWYLTIAQYRERRRTGVVMVPKGVDGEGWAVFSRVFRAVVDSFVADVERWMKEIDKG